MNVEGPFYRLHPLQIVGKSVRILSSANNEDKIYLSIIQKCKTCNSQAFIHNVHIQE